MGLGHQHMFSAKHKLKLFTSCVNSIRYPFIGTLFNNIPIAMSRRHHGHGSRGRSGRPSGLRGRDIGLYYKNLSQGREKDEPIEFGVGPSISLPMDVVNTITQKLNAAANLEDNDSSTEFEEYFHDILNTTFDQFVIKKKAENAPLVNNEYLDNKLKEEQISLNDAEQYISRKASRDKLPVYKKREEIVAAIEANQVVLISGDTGCGKTTQIPQYILDHYIGNNKGSLCKILCTQPRRISAITVSERVAWERGEKLGQSIGYQIRLQSVKPRDNGSIMYCTTGTLLRKMESDPLLQSISHIILDEIHERDVDTDLLLGLLKKIHEHRSDLKIILMSATFSFEVFAKFFNNCPIFQIHGTLFPVEEKYLEDVLEELKFTNFQVQREQTGYRKHLKHNKHAFSAFQGFIEPYIRSIRNEYSRHVIESISNPSSEDINIDLIKQLIFHISRTKPEGAILVFLPGYDKISKLYTALVESNEYNLRSYLIYALHSMMPTADQKQIFSEPPKGTRKVIIATNIAETSITVEDVVYVINSGKIKSTDYDLERNFQTLEEKFVTLANAHQRRGRAGRVRPGICYNLYTRAREYSLDRFPTPEIVRTRLESVLLNLKMLHINDVRSFMRTMLDVPDERAIENGITLLKRIDAIDDQEVITPLGLHLARLPIDPQMGKMMLMAAIFQCVDPITSVAASLSFKDAFYRPLGKEELVDKIKLKFAGDLKSDHLMLANVIDEYRYAKNRGTDRDFCYQNFLSAATLQQLERMKIQFCELLQSTKFVQSSSPKELESNRNSKNLNLIRSIITSGLYPNMAYLRKSKQVRRNVQSVHMMSTPEDKRISFHPGSSNAKQRDFESKYFVYFLKQKTKTLYLLDSSMVYPVALLIFGDRVRAEEDKFGNSVISVANCFKFRTDPWTTNIILKVRQLLNKLLQKKALKPSPIEPNSKDALLIECIQIILSRDDKIDVMALSSGSDFDDADDDDYSFR